jgi:hypothetical protein
MFQTKVVETIKTHFCFRKLFKKRAADEKMWKKYCGAGQATGDNMAHERCMLGT